MQCTSNAHRLNSIANTSPIRLSASISPATRRRLAAACGTVALEALEQRRLLSTTITGSVTLDESPGLQTGGIAVTGEDNDDNDVTLATLQSQAATFYNRLFGAGGLGLSTVFPTAVGVGKSGDSFISVTAAGAITSLGFSEADGDPIPVTGVASGLSAVTGGAITLFTDTVLGSRMVLGRDTTNQIVLAMFLDPTNVNLSTARVWTIQFEALSNPVNTDPDDPDTLDGLGVAAGSQEEFNFNALPSGQNLFGTVGNTSSALVVFGRDVVLHPDGTFTNTSNTINTSKGGGPTTIGVNNQMFDPGEGAKFTFIKNPDPNYLAGATDGLDQNEADDADNILYSGGTTEVNSAFVRISQIQGNSLATMKITALNVSGSPQGRNLINAAGTPVTITAVRVFNAAGQQIASPQVTISGGVATVGGLDAGYRVEWDTSAVHDQVLIEGVVGKFDIGGFGVSEPSSDFAPLTGVRFEDDGPGVEGQAQLVTLTVDETDLTTNHTVQVDPSGVFGPDFGQDGGTSTTFSFALATPPAASGLVDTATGEDVVLSLVSGVVQGRTDTSDLLVFTLSVDASGNLTLDQQRAVVHPDGTSHDETKSLTLNNLLQVTGTVTDNDGDQSSQTVGDDVTLQFKDDGPSILASATGAPTLTVDESDFATNASASFAAQFTPTFGADGQGGTPVSYALSTPGGNSGLVDTATGQNVVLSLVGGVVQGRTAVSNALVFTVSVNASGLVGLDQLRAVVHANTSSNDESRTLAAANLVVLTATATDGDTDTASAPLNIGQLLAFKDDGPAIGPIDNGIVDFATGSTVTKTLNGVVGADPNAVPYTIDAFTASITVNGLLLTGVRSLNQQVVSYYADTNDNDTFGDAGDTEYYRLTLNQAGAGTYTFDVLAEPPPAETSFDFSTLPSGQNLFGMIGDPSAGLVVFGKTPVLNADGTYTNTSNTINTSKGGGGTTIGVDNQMFDPGEGAYFTFVKNPNADFLSNNLDSNEADDADNMLYTGGTLEVDSGFLNVVQTQGGGAKTMRLSAFNIAGSPQGQDLITARGTGTQVNITEVKRNGVVVFSGSALTVNVNIASGDLISWKTDGLHDQVFVEGIAGKWDIGGFGTTQAAPTPDQLLAFTAKATDGDGDTNTSSFMIGIDGTGIFDDNDVLFPTPLNALFSSSPITLEELID